MQESRRIFSLSLIVPFYNEEEGIGLFFDNVLKVIRSLTDDYEIICVNDGSSDKTLNKLEHYQHLDTRMGIINLSRNFGKEAALTAGIDYSTKDIVIPIDADMQDPPELISQMIEKWQKGFDIVLAKRQHRKDKFFKRVTANLFHKLFSYLTNHNLETGAGDFRLLDRKVVEVIKLLPEKTRFMKGIFSWVGFNSTSIYYNRPERSIGLTKMSFFKLLNHAVDGIVSFSTKPLKIWLYIGLFFSMVSFTYASFLIIRTLLLGTDVPGYTSLMVVILFIGGIQLISLGIIGEYIARVYREVKNRPIYIVDSVYGLREKTAEQNKKSI
jgi:polyisoprenyl-phosphate glycosyltransferase